MKTLIPGKILLVLLLSAACMISAAECDLCGLIAKGDSLADIYDHDGAAEAYLAALEIDSLHYEALWKAGDQLTEIAKALPEHEKERIESLYEKAEKLCLRAIEVNPDGYEGYLKLSVVYGRLGLFRGGRQKVRMAVSVRTNAEKALELNPKCDRSMHVLGRWHQNVANLSGVLKFFARTLYGTPLRGSHEEALEWFKQAAEINHDHIEHHLELARTYQYLREQEKMHAPLQTALDLTPANDFDKSLQQEAREMLERIQ